MIDVVWLGAEFVAAGSVTVLVSVTVVAFAGAVDVVLSFVVVACPDCVVLERALFTLATPLDATWTTCEDEPPHAVTAQARTAPANRGAATRTAVHHTIRDADREACLTQRSVFGTPMFSSPPSGDRELFPRDAITSLG